MKLQHLVLVSLRAFFNLENQNKETCNHIWPARTFSNSAVNQSESVTEARNSWKAREFMNPYERRENAGEPIRDCFGFAPD